MPPAPQGILDPTQPEAYVPVDQTQYDTMKTALDAAPDSAQQFAALCAFRESGYDVRDMAAAGFLSGLNPVTAAPATPYPVNSQVGTRLGAPWRTAATDSMAGRDANSGEAHADENAPQPNNLPLFRRGRRLFPQR